MCGYCKSDPSGNTCGAAPFVATKGIEAAVAYVNKQLEQHRCQADVEECDGRCCICVELVLLSGHASAVTHRHIFA